MDISEEQWQLVRRFIPDPEKMVTNPKGGRFQRWVKEGVLEKLLRSLAEDWKAEADST